MSNDLVEIEVTRSYLKSTTIAVPRNGRTDDQLLADYEAEIEDGLNSASLQGGEDFHEFRDSNAIYIQRKAEVGFLIRVRENGKLIGVGYEGYPSCVDKYTSSIKPFKTREGAVNTLQGISNWALFNLGKVSDFTYEVVPITIGG